MSPLIPSRFIAVLIGAALLSITVVGAIGSADAASRAKTKVSIQSEESGFSGFVRSSNESCENDRKVVLYKRRKGKKRNRRKDKRIGSDRAQPNQDAAQWKIDTDKQGRFYAYVGKTTECKAAFSRSVESQPPTSQ